MIVSSGSSARVRKRDEVAVRRDCAQAQQCVEGIPGCAVAVTEERVIPFPTSHIPRTASELQLAEDTRTAEFRDLCMFHRLVGGMRQRQFKHRYLFEQHAQQQRSRFRESGGCGDSATAYSVDRHVLRTDECLASIYSTRHQKVEQLSGETVTPLEEHCDEHVLEDWPIDGCWDEKRPMSAPPFFPPAFPVLDDPAMVVKTDVDEGQAGDVFSIDL